MEWYERHWRKLFIIPILLLVLSIGAIVWTTYETGSFVQKGVTLSGGVSSTVELGGQHTASELQETLQAQFPQADFEVRLLTATDGAQAFTVDAADTHEDPQAGAELLEAFLRSEYDVRSITLEITGPSLGEAFFEQTIVGILLAFLWMGWVVYLYFGNNVWLKILMGVLALTLTVLAVRGVVSGGVGMAILGIIVLATMILYLWNSVPAGAVILAAASTLIFTLAVINLLGVRLSTAGIAAFLMIIGYSVDTDILLSTRMLKRADGSMWERLWGSFTTGITMQLTTTVAVLIALLLTNSEVIRQIMLILLIGMVGDILFTWLQNAGVLWWWVHRNKDKVKGGVE